MGCAAIRGEDFDSAERAFIKCVNLNNEVGIS
jgi:hypothetical protein